MQADIHKNSDINYTAVKASKFTISAMLKHSIDFLCIFYSKIWFSFVQL